MTLADLLTTLETRGALPASRVKDLKTSIKYLAHALGHASPEQCPVDAACREEATWAKALETHFATLETQGRTISAVTRRNTRNNLRVVLTAAEAHGLLTAPLPPRLLARPASVRTSDASSGRRPPTRPPMEPSSATATACRSAQWPARYSRAGGPTARPAACASGRTSFRSYVKILETYFGYVAERLWPHRHVGGPL